MARWIDQTLHVSPKAEIVLCENRVVIQIADNQGWDGYASFEPSSREDSASMSIALRLAAKRIEEIGKGLN
jgi:hypothetical protein